MEVCSFIHFVDIAYNSTADFRIVILEGETQMKAIYDCIGKDYSVGRQSDRNIASSIHQYLSGSNSILNIGAGTGSCEASDTDLAAIESSMEMINQLQFDAQKRIWH